MKAKLIITLFFCYLSLNGQDKQASKLIGAWQDSPEYESGLVNTYLFFPDHSYQFWYDKINCQQNCSTYYHKGIWQIKNDSLVLNITERKIVVGGTFLKVVEDDGVIRIVTAGTDSIIAYPKPEVITYPLLMMLPNHNRECITIDENKYWKFEDDPNKF